MTPSSRKIIPIFSTFSTFFLLLFLLLTGLLMFCDRAPICPDGVSAVGFSHLNQWVFTATASVHGVCKFISARLGELACIILAIYAAIGFRQLLKNRSLKAVDHKLYAMAGLCLATFLLNYFFTHILTINYRPVFETDGSLEASYPSSHTLLAITVFGASMAICDSWLTNTIYLPFGKGSFTNLVRSILISVGCLWLRRVSLIVHTVLAILLILTRALAGVHWITDILGGILLGLALLFSCLPHLNKQEN